MPTPKNVVLNLTRFLATLTLVLAPVVVCAAPPEARDPVAATTQAAEETSKPTSGKRVTAKEVAKFKSLAENTDRGQVYKQKFNEATKIIVKEL